MKRYITKAGYVQFGGYTNGERLEHRVVWSNHHGKIPKGMQIHHLNGNKQDNRIENLSLLTDAQNKQKEDRFGKGYTFYKKQTNNPYMSRRTVNGVVKYFGSFGTPCGAYMASRMGYVNGCC